MPCLKCKADFNLLTWKLKCSDCEQYHCSKCLRKAKGAMFCDKCAILNKRPPDREKLMELRSKDLRDYLNKNHISTHGLVEKSELVELFYRRPIPAHGRKGHTRLTSVFSGSVPNLATQSQDHINNLRSNIESNIHNVRSYAENAIHNLGRRVGPSANSSTNDFSRTSTPGQSNQNFATADFSFTTDGIATDGGSFAFEMGQSGYTSAHVPVTNDQSQPSNTSQYAREASSEPNLSSSPRKYPKLSDFKTAEELNDLSVKQLKELLTLNRVDYKGCVEKSELLDRASRLWNDTNQHTTEDFSDTSVDNLCKICMDAPLECVILECGHVATCVDCGKRLAECPICRQYVTRVVRTFKA